MNKPFRKYLLSLCILLLSVYCFTHAQPLKDSAARKVTTFENSVRHYFHPVIDTQAKVSERFTSGSKELVRIYNEKSEEESFGFQLAKTYIPMGKYFTSLYPVNSKGLFYDVKKKLQFYTHWFNTSSRKYNILCVFRI